MNQNEFEIQQALRDKITRMEEQLKDLQSDVSWCKEHLEIVISKLAGISGGWKLLVTVLTLTALFGAFLAETFHYLTGGH